MKMVSKALSPLEKVFYDMTVGDFADYPCSTALVGEKHNFTVAYGNADYAITRFGGELCFVRVISDIKEHIKLYSIEHMPSVFAAPQFEEPDEYLRYTPGLYPDMLIPLNEETRLSVIPRLLNSIWVETDTSCVPAGEHKITLEFFDDKGNVLSTCTHSLKIINVRLPEADMIVTHWLYADCIADYYRFEVFSEDFWSCLEKQLTTYADAGNNMIYTPLFTPPLDTYVGGERTTTQLVDVKVTENGYEFGFNNFRRWVLLCKKCGIAYFEMSHLFTQWGAFHAPKVMAEVDGKQKKIFGWETDSHGREYEQFLDAFLPRLLEQLEELGIDKNTYFHISDEPMREHLESYRACSNIIRKHLSGYPIMDAMTDPEFYDEGMLDVPIPFIGHVGGFFERNIKPRFVYYCGSDKGQMGRTFSMPSSRNRISGTLFYAFDVDGFLHWGYNFYNSAESRRKINPYAITDADKKFCSGGSFLVYPAEDGGSYISIRLAVFRDGLQDMRALKLCETLCGKKAVMAVICELNGGEMLDITRTPKDRNYTIKLRERINAMIEEKANS